MSNSFFISLLYTLGVIDTIMMIASFTCVICHRHNFVYLLCDYSIGNYSPFEPVGNSSYFLILTGLFLILIPVCEIAYFKLSVSRLRPKNRMMTGLECFFVTKEIEKRFYSRPFSLMSEPRKKLRKTLFRLGTLLTISGMIIHLIFNTL